MEVLVISVSAPSCFKENVFCMLITSLLILGYVFVQVVSYVLGRIAYWRERRSYIENNQDYIDQLESMDAQYAPEPPDVELAEKCGAYLAGKFPSGIEAAVRNVSGEELLDMFAQLEKDAEQLMGLDLDNVDFYQSETPPESGYFGYYDSSDNSLHINKIYILSGDPRLVQEQVSTIFHELKHTRQWKAIRGCADDGDQLGYSDAQVAAWAENFMHYIPPAISDELYRKQDVERDTFGFEKLVFENFNKQIA